MAPVDRHRLFGLGVAACLAGFSAPAARAVPPDPERALAEETCSEALMRLTEARESDALVPTTDRAGLLARAEAAALRLCGTLPDDLPLAPTDGREYAPLREK